MDTQFAYDAEYVDKVNKEKPWAQKNSEKYFSKCSISALAAMKMLKHSLAGVKKGREGESGQPVEVMGLLVGKPDGNTIVVVDAYALPVEGIEYKVEAAEEAQGYMIQLAESLELRRNERCIGWYHSHPFDVGTRPQYFMSSVDVQTQASWQFSIPQWTAIVIDPLRSLAKQEPQLGTFRCFPAAHNPPANIGPDGQTYDKETMQLRWGHSPHRYYMLETTYFLSSLGNQLLDTMSRNNLWVRVLSSAGILEEENRQGFSERVKNASEKLGKAQSSMGQSGYAFSGGRGPRGASGGKATSDALSEGSQACEELAIEQCTGHANQIAKAVLFNQLLIQKIKEHTER